MTNANFTDLLRHECLPQPLATALQTEALNGIGKDAKLLLAAAVMPSWLAGDEIMFIGGQFDADLWMPCPQVP